MPVLVGLNKVAICFLLCFGVCLVAFLAGLHRVKSSAICVAAFTTKLSATCCIITLLKPLLGTGVFHHRTKVLKLSSVRGSLSVAVEASWMREMSATLKPPRTDDD